jgi:murein L,D-transpeptidase YcbB/YkuD
VKCATVVLCLLLAAGSSSGSQAARGTPVQRPDVVPALRRLIENPAGLLSIRLTAAEQRELASLYGGADGPLWVDTWGRPGRDAREAMDLLTAAADDGLDPGDYNVSGMAALSALIGDPSGATASNIARFDASLSMGTLRYLSDLHLGRVDPRAMGFRVPKQEPHDFVAPLRAALAQHRIPALAAEFAPSLAVYQQLRGTLARYRTLASDPLLQSFTLPAVTVRPGEPWTTAVRLARRLEALGDLPWAESPAHGAAVYDGSLVEGVRRFQRRHGLEPDGVLGPATRAALNVPIAWRARQIELALERLRWVPDIGEERFLAVNIPMFRVWGIQPAATGSTQSFSTEVIVGRALNTQTPVLVEEMEHVIFRPYWNVPSSIVRNEIMPAVRRDANYLHRQNMEIVEGQSDNARVVPATAANLERARLGVLRIRQRPGAHNSLGLVKFVFPNDSSVYLHGTPAQALFSRPRRDFSHGCIRVADPVGLAEWVLSDHPEWTRERIISAMNGHQPRRVDLRRPIRVVLFYITAVVTLEEGVHFVNDIYGHDTRLDAYLTRRLES